MYIETERLIITEYTEAMAHSHHANSLDADNREFLSDEVCETEEAARGKLVWLMGFYENADGPLVYPVLLKGGAHIGHVQACPIQEGWEIGYHIAAAYAGKGYATEATRAFLPLAMRRLGLSEIRGICRADNAASLRVLEKCGFVLESKTEWVSRYQFTPAAGGKTLYISDLDGTLLNNRAALSAFAVESLSRLMRDGLHFTAATARTWEGARPILKDILPLPAPIVLQNGALIYDTQTRRYIKKEIMPEALALELLRIMKAHGQTCIFYCVQDDRMQVYHEDLDGWPVLRDFIAPRVFLYGDQMARVSDLAAHAGEDAVYLMTQGAHDDLIPLRTAVEALPGLACLLYPDSYIPGNWYFECFSRSASKYQAVLFLREQYGYDRVIGFGDNLNDIPLFHACDEAYAVANAREELKAVATGVIGPNEAGGVVRFLCGA